MRITLRYDRDGFISAIKEFCVKKRISLNAWLSNAIDNQAKKDGISEVKNEDDQD